ncbi:hypothetical protein GCM10007111_03840 [Virgibacillus kapii]|uniref:Uncharacterized protein n=1 Tax=Virgibacillus kapii TaxID=1638645 RepID=A0ABQ2D3T8_9BACI|nr:hypothetical protein GCM10007111_03840 [Virgibacillus kapii]
MNEELKQLAKDFIILPFGVKVFEQDKILKYCLSKYDRTSTFVISSASIKYLLLIFFLHITINTIS